VSDLAEFGVETTDGSDVNRDRHDHCSLCGSELEFGSGADTDRCIAKARSQDFRRCEHDATDGDSLCQTHLRAHRKNGSVTVPSERLDQLPDRGSCPTEGCPR